MKRYPRRSIVGGAGAGLLAAAGAAALARPALVRAGGDPGGQATTIVQWIERNAVPIASTAPGAPLDDLAPLRRWIGDAAIVGLGESTHGAAEEIALKHRTLRLLVEQMGFRSIAWEDDWTMGLQLDAYIGSGEGNLDALVGQMSPQWPSRQVADVLRWLRDFNAGRADAGKVRFTGVEYYLTRPLVYDAVEAYVAGTAPERLPELRGHLLAIRPATSMPFEHIQWFMGVADKAPYVDHARQVYALVESLPHRPGDRAHALALHHARQIVSFYEHFTLSEADALVYRDARAAENLRWWRDYTGHKIAYWAASPHTVNAPQLRIAVPPDPDMRFASAGSYLRRWYGQGYLSIGFTCDHGTVGLGAGETITLPPPAPDWFERPFGEVDEVGEVGAAGAVGGDQFSLDLRTPAPPPVRSWLEAPVKTRGLADRGLDSFMDGGTLAQWFDVIVHRQELSPLLPLSPAPPVLTA
jgi:erythromycin esterase